MRLLSLIPEGQQLNINTDGIKNKILSVYQEKKKNEWHLNKKGFWTFQEIISSFFSSSFFFSFIFKGEWKFVELSEAIAKKFV